MRTRGAIARDVGESVIYAIILASVYAIFATAVFAVSGSEAFTQHGTTLPQVLLTYYSSAIVGGTVVGLLWPWRRTMLGSITIRILVAAIAFFCIQVTSKGPFWRWNSVQWETLIVLSVIFAVISYFIWKPS